MRSRRSASSRTLRAALGAAILVVASACGNDSSTDPAQNDAAAARAVSVFTQLADSVARSGGDAEMGATYSSVAEAVRQGGRISSIVITIDGVPTPFYATALLTEVNSQCRSQICIAILQIVTLRSMVAWQQDNPRRVVQLSSAVDGDPIRAYLVPVLAPYVGRSASLTFFDGKSGIYFGTSGSQKFDVTKSAVPCAPTAERPFIANTSAPPHCTQADFFVTFNGKVEPSSFRAGRNNATGSHTLSMSTQQVLGARLALTAALPPTPPIVVTPSAPLPATLTTKVDSVVTLTLTVNNPTSSPVKIDYSSGQHFDFTVHDAASGEVLWLWSADKLFMQALSSETIPANGSLVYTAQWKPTKSGSFVATGSLVSLSHRAAARMAISVP